MSSADNRKGNRPGSSSGVRHPMLTGILIGLILGVGVSAAVAVWVARMPSPFQNRMNDNGLPAAATGPVAAPGANAPSAAGAQGPGGQGTGGQSNGNQGAGLADPAAPQSGGNLPPAGKPDANPAAGNGASGAEGVSGTLRTSGPSAVAGAGAAGNGAGAGGAGAPANAGAGNGAGQDAGVQTQTPTGGKPNLKPAATLDTIQAVFLQVGAFGAEEDAQRQVETVAQVSGARARIVSSVSGDRTLYRVRIGPITHGAELSELAEALKANGISSSTVKAGPSDLTP